jgi:hypothetical protein
METGKLSKSLVTAGKYEMCPKYVRFEVSSAVTTKNAIFWLADPFKA